MAQLFKKSAIFAHLIMIGCACLAPAAAPAQTDIENGVAVTIPVNAEMDNNFSVLVTDIQLGTLGVTNGSGNASVTITPTGTLLEQNDGGQTRIVAKGDNAGQGILDISSALSLQAVQIRYSNVQDLTCDSCGGTPPRLIISEITDDATDQQGLWSESNPDPDADAVSGIVTTNADGEALVNIGVTIHTDSTNQPYPSGEYAGSIDITLEY